jgi:hypothetical protein
VDVEGMVQALRSITGGDAVRGRCLRLASLARAGIGGRSGVGPSGFLFFRVFRVFRGQQTSLQRPDAGSERSVESLKKSGAQDRVPGPTASELSDHESDSEDSPRLPACQPMLPGRSTRRCSQATRRRSDASKSRPGASNYVSPADFRFSAPAMPLSPIAHRDQRGNSTSTSLLSSRRECRKIPVRLQHTRAWSRDEAAWSLAKLTHLDEL